MRKENRKWTRERRKRKKDKAIRISLQRRY
jgi:hypothetical protein